MWYSESKMQIQGTKIVFSVALLGLSAAGIVAASTSYGFQAEEDIRQGELVSVEKERPEYVTPAHTDNRENLIGVATEAATIDFVEETTNVKVVTEGVTTVLVSDLNGAIQKGDIIAPSPLKGIGGKAKTSGRVVGFARENFSANSTNTRVIAVRHNNGRTQEVTVGRIPVFVDVHQLQTERETLFLFGPLKEVVEEVSGRHVSLLRLVLVLAVAVFAILIAVLLLWRVVSLHISSRDKNYLTRKDVLFGSGQIIAMGVLILIVGVAIIYVLLTI